MTTRTRTAAVLVALAVLTGAASTNAATAAGTTKKKPTTTKKKTVKKTTTTKRPTTTQATTTTIASVNPISDQAVKAAYDRIMNLHYALSQDPRPYRTELPKVMTGDALMYWLKYYGSVPAGERWTGKREDLKSIDFKVTELSDTAAVVRVCEYLSGAPAVDKNGAIVPGSDATLVDDRRLEFQYAGKTKGWLQSKIFNLNDQVGESTCADGKV
jgi:hypothetical protein